MKENKTTMNAQARVEYEPVSVKVMKITPQGVLCQSGGVEQDAMMQMFDRGDYL